MKKEKSFSFLLWNVYVGLLFYLKSDIGCVKNIDDEVGIVSFMTTYTPVHKSSNKLKLVLGWHNVTFTLAKVLSRSDLYSFKAITR